jgi:endonuclease/exonuclease/phosphatase family metal-dependent hydrolase
MAKRPAKTTSKTTSKTTAKKSAPPTKRATRSSRGLGYRNSVLTSENDNLSRVFEDFVPDWAEDSDRFLNIVQWNIEWFGAAKSRAKDRNRYGLVLDVLKALNADLFVFQEVAGPNSTQLGVMNAIAEDLTAAGSGDYRVEYTNAGGEQRVAMMWDRDYLRAKTEVSDLFPSGTHRLMNGKDAFAGRTPLYGHFEMRMAEANERVDFQALGVHLKAMSDGAPQRKKSAEVLADWVQNDGQLTDTDILILGDFNAPPSDASSWQPLMDLEANDPRVQFQSINDESEFSYLWLANQSNRFVSRIDLSVVSLSGEFEAAPGMLAKPIRWVPIEKALAEAGGLKSTEARAMLKEVKESVSDHLPLIHRFYYRPAQR